MNVLALCSGIGGIELGLDRATGGRSRVVCYVEREAYAAGILVKKMEDGSLAPAPIWSDLHTFDAGAWRGLVDCVTAGFPCQPFSPAGKRKGLEDERWIWPDIARIIGDVEPGAVFLENVPGLAVRGLGEVLGSLADLGFDAVWDVFSAESVGAPHLRRRLFIFASHQLSDPNGIGIRDESWGRNNGTQGGGVSIPVNLGQAVANDDGVGGSSRFGTTDVRGRVPDDLEARCDSPLPQWPPGPEDLHAWGQVPADTQPALCRMADGLSGRVERLRTLGNAVVPAVAENAWRVLTRRLTALGR